MKSVQNNVVLSKVYYTTAEAASLSGLSQKALRAGAESGRFPAIRVGRVLRFNLAGVFATLEHEQRSNPK